MKNYWIIAAVIAAALLLYPYLGLNSSQPATEEPTESHIIKREMVKHDSVAKSDDKNNLSDIEDLLKK